MGDTTNKSKVDDLKQSGDQLIYPITSQNIY